MDFAQSPPPHYRGEPLKGKTLHVYWEQGLGDTLQFCRFAALLAEQGVQVILNVQPPLVALLSSLLPDVEVISEAPFLRSADYQVPLLSLPHFLGVRVETLPKIPHLDSVASDLKIHGRHRVASVGGTPKIGLVWSGSRAHKNDRNRSIPFEVIRPILDLPFSFHCLQQEIREEERGTVEAAQSLTCYERLLLDFTDTAALILEMDLVISVDTSVAHLAGVLGKPVWILLPYTPDFRWLLERADSPWYPSARLYRQDLRREWPSVIQTVVEDLKKKDF